ncbi:hypothetical protein [Streptoalloteichus tenebrarius]|uniref:hypothetical protein n=1 Tax=Streptoalloteichus tenebrarius (strain ATCC 17920 / DSM 40477 / JCM 4838 / CBS 697.72 / NBRC 16177 / NCIMB 11028 / NRRL B-12390 / A12253. 1 / ISP 5477) TaxID=1933 RepID=UPI0020A48112|nr:hypothetical protein [Streptoalloteichus tenebrarius]
MNAPRPDRVRVVSALTALPAPGAPDQPRPTGLTGGGRGADRAGHRHFPPASPEVPTSARRPCAVGHANPGDVTIVRGQHSADQVMESWMNSPGHRVALPHRASAVLPTGTRSHRTRVVGR